MRKLSIKEFSVIIEMEYMVLIWNFEGKILSLFWIGGVWFICGLRKLRCLIGYFLYRFEVYDRCVDKK